jgi:hypothetical protein
MHVMSFARNGNVESRLRARILTMQRDHDNMTTTTRREKCGGQTADKTGDS